MRARTIVNARGTQHVRRNTQAEYKSAKRRNVTVVETLCGRHFEPAKVPVRGCCATCFEIAAGRGSRR